MHHYPIPSIVNVNQCTRNSRCLFVITELSVWTCTSPAACGRQLLWMKSISVLHGFIRRQARYSCCVSWKLTRT